MVVRDFGGCLGFPLCVKRFKGFVEAQVSRFARVWNLKGPMFRVRNFGFRGFRDLRLRPPGGEFQRL